MIDCEAMYNVFLKDPYCTTLIYKASNEVDAINVIKQNIKTYFPKYSHCIPVCKLNYDNGIKVTFGNPDCYYIISFN